MLHDSATTCQVGRFRRGPDRCRPGAVSPFPASVRRTSVRRARHSRRTGRPPPRPVRRGRRPLALPTALAERPRRERRAPAPRADALNAAAHVAPRVVVGRDDGPADPLGWGVEGAARAPVRRRSQAISASTQRFHLSGAPHGAPAVFAWTSGRRPGSGSHGARSATARRSRCRSRRTAPPRAAAPGVAGCGRARSPRTRRTDGSPPAARARTGPRVRGTRLALSPHGGRAPGDAGSRDTAPAIRMRACSPRSGAPEPPRAAGSRDTAGRPPGRPAACPVDRPAAAPTPRQQRDIASGVRDVVGGRRQASQPTRRMASARSTPASVNALTARARLAVSSVPAARPMVSAAGRSSRRASSSAITSASGCTVSVQNRRSASRCAVLSVNPHRPERRRDAEARQDGTLDVLPQRHEPHRRRGAEPGRFPVAPRRPRRAVAVRARRRLG